MIWKYNPQYKIFSSEYFTISVKEYISTSGPRTIYYKLSKANKWIGDFDRLEIAQKVAEIFDN